MIATPLGLQLYLFCINLQLLIKHNPSIKTIPSYTKQEVEKLDDSEIVDLIVSSAGPEFFEEIYDRYALKIFRRCLSFTKDEAEAKDLAHDIVVKIYLNLAKYSKKSKFSTWIYAITFNYCVDHQAKKKKERTLTEELKFQDASAESELEPSDDELLEINIETLTILLQKLSVAEKSILLMKYQDGLSIREIAGMLEAGESAVKMKLKRAKAKLIKLYEEGK